MHAFLFLVAFAVAGCQTPPPPKTGEAPQDFVQVSPGVWRSAQPTNPDEWKYVAKGSCEKIGGKVSAGGSGPGNAPSRWAY